MSILPRQFSAAKFEYYPQDKIYVSCPKCHSVAIVQGARDNVYCLMQAEIVCLDCSYSHRRSTLNPKVI